jgi:hypothetical protein
MQESAWFVNLGSLADVGGSLQNKSQVPFEREKPLSRISR